MTMFKKIKDFLFFEYEWIVDCTELVPPDDIEKNRVYAALGYLIFFIPLVFADSSPFARFHCNQALINMLLSTIVAVVLSFIPYAGVVLLIVQEVLCIVFAVRGMVYALKGKAVGIPLVGWITLLKY